MNLSMWRLLILWGPLLTTCWGHMLLGSAAARSRLLTAGSVEQERDQEGDSIDTDELLAFIDNLLPAQSEAYLHADIERKPTDAKRSESFKDFLLEDVDFARCLDGTAAGGYERINPNSSTVIIQLQGGGYCDDFESCSSRAADDEAGLGGSSKWGYECDQGLCTGIVSTDCRENPDFCDASLVLLRYCTGDHWRGTRTQPTFLCRNGDGQECGDFWFSGQKVVEATLQRLFDKNILQKGSKLILAGRSSGGVGVLNLIDFLNEGMLAPRGVDVRGLLLWSVDVDYPTLSTYDIPWFKSGHARDQMDTQQKRKFYQPRMPKACREVDESYLDRPWLCQPHELLRHSKTPVFVATNLWSPLAIGDFVLNGTTCSYARKYGETARRVYEGLTKAREDHGLFAASCFAHTVPWDTSVASPACGHVGCSLRDVFASWYFGDKRSPTSVVEEDCGRIPCNSHCKSQRASNMLSVCQA